MRLIIIVLSIIAALALVQQQPSDSTLIQRELEAATPKTTGSLVGGGSSGIASVIFTDTFTDIK